LDKIIYLDNNSTTPLDPRVLEAMLPYLTDIYGNAASSHYFGTIAKKAVEEARYKVAELINAKSNEIVFTSGATESINLGVKGFALANKYIGNHIITVESEHKAVLDTCKYLEGIGFEITYLPVKDDGLIDLELFEATFRPETILVCIMYVNNEIGVIQDIRRLSTITHKKGVSFFCDATQAVGKIDSSVKELGIDLMSFSAHKFYGPKGIGGLYCSSNSNILPLTHGGGHENGLRSGTLNVPAIVGMSKASELAKAEMKSDSIRIKDLRDELENELLKVPFSFVNGSVQKRLYNVSNICFPGIQADYIIGKLKNIAISNGSACTSAFIEPSYVLRAIGLNDKNSTESIRISLGRFNTKNDIEILIKSFMNIV
jgi:cysteine desulfurase